MHFRDKQQKEAYTHSSDIQVGNFKSIYINQKMYNFKMILVIKGGK